MKVSDVLDGAGAAADVVFVMPRPIELIAADVIAVLDLRFPFGVRIDRVSDSLIVGNDDLAFCITRKEIEDDVHLQHAAESFQRLLEVLKTWPSHHTATVLR